MIAPNQHVRRGLLGLLLGFSLSRLGFADFGEVHRMLTFADLRLVLTFAGAVVVATLGFLAMARGRTLPRRSVHKGTVAGGVLFGIGWAVTGTCPAVAPVQVGEGRLLGLVTLVGILAGVWLFSLARARFFRWDMGSCADE